MIAYVRQDGSILAGCAAASPSVLSTITKIPDGCTAIYVDDKQYPNVWTDMGEYTIGSNGTPVYKPIPDSVKLANAQQAKIAQIWNGYTQTLAAGFNATIGGTQYTFGWSTDDKTNLMATQESITDGFISFPINYSDINGHPVPLSSQADLDTIKKTASSFFANQHQQALTLIGQVQQAATVDAVNAISWSPAAY